MTGTAYLFLRDADGVTSSLGYLHDHEFGRVILDLLPWSDHKSKITTEGSTVITEPGIGYRLQGDAPEAS